MQKYRKIILSKDKLFYGWHGIRSPIEPKTTYPKSIKLIVESYKPFSNQTDTVKSKTSKPLSSNISIKEIKKIYQNTEIQAFSDEYLANLRNDCWQLIHHYARSSREHSRIISYYCHALIKTMDYPANLLMPADYFSVGQCIALLKSILNKRQFSLLGWYLLAIIFKSHYPI